MYSQFAPPLPPAGGGGLVQEAYPQAVRTTVHLDSRDRDYAVHPSSSEFVVELPETLHSVRYAVLVLAEMPISYYVFSSARGTSSLRVTLDWVDAVTHDVAVPDGNYTTASMATALKAALETAFPGATFTVAFDQASQRCSITTSDGVLSVDATGAARRTDLGYFLGFARGVVTGGSGSTVVGTGVAAMNPENYLLLDIEELNGLGQSALYHAGGSGRKTFAKIPLCGDSYSYSFYDKYFTGAEQRPPLSRLDRLRVSVRFHDGSLVDLNGAEWSFTIQFACTLTRSA